MEEEKTEQKDRYQIYNCYSPEHKFNNRYFGICGNTLAELEEKISKILKIERGTFELYYSECLIQNDEFLRAIRKPYASNQTLSINVYKNKFNETLKLFHKPDISVNRNEVETFSVKSDSEIIEAGEKDAECERIYNLWFVAVVNKNRLEKSFFDIIILDFQRFSKSAAFYNSSREFILSVLSVEEIPFVESEVELLQHLANWYAYHPTVDIQSLLAKVKLHTIPPEVLITKVEPLNVVPVSMLYKLIQNWVSNQFEAKTFHFASPDKSYELRNFLIPKYESTIADYFKNSTKWQYSEDLSINSILQQAKHVPYKLKLHPMADVNSQSNLRTTNYNQSGVGVHSSSTGELCYVEAVFPYHVVVNRIILSAPNRSTFPSEIDYRLEYITIESANDDGSNYTPVQRIEVGYSNTGAVIVDLTSKKIIAKRVRLASYISVGTSTLIFE